jgi:hypothetical protein
LNVKILVFFCNFPANFFPNFFPLGARFLLLPTATVLCFLFGGCLMDLHVGAVFGNLLMPLWNKNLRKFDLNLEVCANKLPLHYAIKYN